MAAPFDQQPTAAANSQTYQGSATTPAAHADKITSESNGAINVAHYVKKTVTRFPFKYPDVSLDVLGIKPGMTPERAKRKLIDYYKSTPSTTTTNTGLGLSYYYKDIYLSSQAYINQMMAHSRSGLDSTTVLFGNPVIGNTVVGIIRQITFNVKTEPKVSQLKAALYKKYGPDTTTIGGRMYWEYGKSGLIKKATSPTCYTTNRNADLNTPNQYANNSNLTGSGAQVYACVYAEIDLDDTDYSRVNQLTLTLDDVVNTVLSNKAALKNMRMAAVSDYKKFNKPVSVPNL